MSAAREITLSALVGRTVHDADDRRVGRIDDVHAEISMRDDERSEYVVVAYVIGGRRVPWDALDLSDPARPRLRGRAADYATLTST